MKMADVNSTSFLFLPVMRVYGKYSNQNQPVLFAIFEILTGTLLIF